MEVFPQDNRFCFSLNLIQMADLFELYVRLCYGHKCVNSALCLIDLAFEMFKELELKTW